MPYSKRDKLRIEQGICLKCGAEPPAGELLNCAACNEVIKQKARLRYALKTQRIKQALKNKRLSYTTLKARRTSGVHSR